MSEICFKIRPLWTSLEVQWLRLHVPKVGGLGSVPGQGIRPYMRQLCIQERVLSCFSRVYL